MVLKGVLSSVMINKQHQAGGCPTEYSAGSGEYKGSSSIRYILPAMIFRSNKCLQDLKMAKRK